MMRFRVSFVLYYTNLHTMATRSIQIESTTLDELVEKITSEVTQKLDKEKKHRDTNQDPRFISPLEVATIFNVTVTTVYNWEYKGFFKAFRIGGRKRFLKSEVLDFAEKCQVNE